MEIISAIRKPVLVASKPQKASGGCCVFFWKLNKTRSSFINVGQP
jgi:hypothetical protein